MSPFTYKILVVPILFKLFLGNHGCNECLSANSMSYPEDAFQDPALHSLDLTFCWPFFQSLALEVGNTNTTFRATVIYIWDFEEFLH